MEEGSQASTGPKRKGRKVRELGSSNNESNSELNSAKKNCSCQRQNIHGKGKKYLHYQIVRIFARVSWVSQSVWLPKHFSENQCTRYLLKYNKSVTDINNLAGFCQEINCITSCYIHIPSAGFPSSSLSQNFFSVTLPCVLCFFFAFSPLPPSLF